MSEEPEKDADWAEWIAWHLEQAGYSTIVQAWDIRPGDNFVARMDEATKTAERTIVVVTPNFFDSSFAPSEWAAAFASDPKGEKRLVVPVLVEGADIEGLLGQIVYIDLTGSEGEDAVRVLLAGVQPGRSKPTTAPDFPGRRQQGASQQQPQVSPGPDWQPLGKEVRPSWNAENAGGWNRSGATTLEVELIPNSDQLVAVRTLSELGEKLAAAGRHGGLFSSTQQLESESTAESVSVSSVRERYSSEAGLRFTRRGHRAAWIELPNDTLGSVFDAKELTPRLATVLQLLASIEVPLSDRYVVAGRIGPLMMLTVGDSKVVGNRSSASMSFGGRDAYELPLEDSVNFRALSSEAHEVAAEVVARLQAGLGSL